MNLKEEMLRLMITTTMKFTPTMITNDRDEEDTANSNVNNTADNNMYTIMSLLIPVLSLLLMSGINGLTACFLW